MSLWISTPKYCRPYALTPAIRSRKLLHCVMALDFKASSVEDIGGCGSIVEGYLENSVIGNSMRPWTMDGWHVREAMKTRSPIPPTGPNHSARWEPAVCKGNSIIPPVFELMWPLPSEGLYLLSLLWTGEIVAHFGNFGSLGSPQWSRDPLQTIKDSE